METGSKNILGLSSWSSPSYCTVPA